MIEFDDVIAVLLTDGWHAVASNTFSVQPYMFTDSGQQVSPNALGFIFESGANTYQDPLSSLLAVQTS